MSYSFSDASLKKMKGIHPALLAVSSHALEYQIIDITILPKGGVRTVAAQRELVKSGKSKTMNSCHLIQKDGYGHAIDISPYPVDWNDIKRFISVAHCMRCSAIENNIRIKWGAVWDRYLNDLQPNLEQEVTDYVNRRKAKGLRSFLDYPHFQFEGVIQ